VKIVIAGRGRVGTALAQGLRDAGLDCELLAGRRRADGLPQGTSVVILAVPDAAIRACARGLRGLPPGCVVLHCAGARGVDELADCRTAGARIGAMHPLVSFADAQHPPALAGSSFVVAGDAAAIEAARALAGALGARTVSADVHGPAYHALAALAANGTAALAHAAVGGLQRLGLERRAAEQALAGLLATVAQNVERLGVPKALSGPIARGDALTVAAHRAALRAAAPEAAAAYRAVAPLVLRCALDAGLAPAAAAAIEEALNVSE